VDKKGGGGDKKPSGGGRKRIILFYRKRKEGSRKTTGCWGGLGRSILKGRVSRSNLGSVDFEALKGGGGRQ